MILIALGANLPGPYGAPEESLRRALEHLDVHGVRVLRFSSIWCSAPVPVSDQPWYKNSVAIVETSLDAQGIIGVLHEVEAEFGRDRSVEGERNAARVLDLDLLAYHEHVLASEVLHVPHPRMHMRGFVLYPLLEVAPDWVHPVLKRSVSELIEGLAVDETLSRSDEFAA